MRASLLLVAFLIVAGSSSSAYGKTAWDTIRTRKDLKIATAAIRRAGLADELDNKNLVATLLVPNDKAFGKLLKDLKVTQEELLNTPDLESLLLYHVIPGTAARSFSLKTKFTAYPTLLEDATVSLRRSPSGYTVYFHALFSKGRAVVKNIRADKAVIHTVDTVLLPVDPRLTILSAIRPVPELSTFTAGVMASSLSQELIAYDTMATVFAPTNAALDAALTALNLTGEQLLADKALLDYVVGYHVVPNSRQSASELTDGEILISAAQHLPLRVAKSAAGTFIWGASNTVKVVRADINAGNSVVHVVDGVLLPPRAPKTIEEAVLNYPDRLSILVSVTNVSHEIRSEAADPATSVTVLAPTNAAFLAALANLGGVVGGLANNATIIDALLSYHVLTQPYRIADLVHGQTIQTRFGLPLTVNKDSGSGLVCFVGMVNTACIVAADINAGASVMHMIDAVLIPPIAM